jgi:hypothetical protein
MAGPLPSVVPMIAACDFVRVAGKRKPRRRAGVRGVVNHANRESDSHFFGSSPPSQARNSQRPLSLTSTSV